MSLSQDGMDRFLMYTPRLMGVHGFMTKLEVPSKNANCGHRLRGTRGRSPSTKNSATKTATVTVLLLLLVLAVSVRDTHCSERPTIARLHHHAHYIRRDNLRSPQHWRRSPMPSFLVTGSVLTAAAATVSKTCNAHPLSMSLRSKIPGRQALGKSDTNDSRTTSTTPEQPLSDFLDAELGVAQVGENLAASLQDSSSVDTQQQQQQQQQEVETGSGRWWGQGKGGSREGKGEQEKKKRRGLFTYDWKNGERVQWVANKQSRAMVVEEEGRRRLKDYLALPPTEYSLLDPKMITRLSDDEFRMDCGTLNILGTKVMPMLFVRVKVEAEQSMAEIMVERVELDGSDAVRSAGGTFNVTSSTMVSCAEPQNGREGESKLELNTRAHIEIDILVPNENFIPVGVIRRSGNFVMQRVVDIGLPQFTKFLSRDYKRWSTGDNERTAVAADGESLIDASVE